MAVGLAKELRVSLGSRVWSPPVWALLLAFAGVLFFCRLGVWQLDRAVEKEVMIASYAAHASQPAMALPDLLQQKQIEDRRVHIDGHWDNSKLVLLENQMRGPQAGFHVYTAFVPLNSPQAILVNRGWVPVVADIQKLPSVPPAQATQISGSVAFPSHFFTVAEPDYSQQPLRVARLDMVSLARAVGTELYPFVLRLDAIDSDGFVREWTPAARIGMAPEKHRAYAFQWFSLALVVLVVLVLVNLRNKDDIEV